jgi:hypothetical protein
MRQAGLVLMVSCIGLGSVAGCSDSQPKIYKSNRAEILKQQAELPDLPATKSEGGPAGFRVQPKSMDQSKK